MNEDGDRLIWIAGGALVACLAALWATGALAAVVLGGGWDPLPVAELPKTATPPPRSSMAAPTPSTRARRCTNRSASSPSSRWLRRGLFAVVYGTAAGTGRPLDSPFLDSGAGHGGAVQRYFG